MKKLLKFIFGFIGIILLLVIILAVVLFIMIKDDTNNTSKEIVNANVTLEESLNHQIVTGLSEITTTKKATIKLNEHDLNELLYGASKKIDSIGVLKIESMYMELDESKYVLCVPVSVFGVKSLVKGEVALFADSEKISVSVSKLSAGKAGISSGLINKAIALFKLEDKIIEAAKEYYIDATLDGDNLSATITRKNIVKLLKDLTKDSTESSLFEALADIFLVKTNTIVLNINNPLDLNVVVDLSEFDGEVSSKFISAKTKTTDLINSHIINATDAALVLKYYVAGYEYLKDDEKKEIKTLLAKKYNEVQLISETGMVDRVDLNLADVLASQASGLLVGNLGFKLSDSNLNSVFSKLGVVGTTIGFGSYRTGETAYIIIEKLYTFIENDNIYVMLDLNINDLVLNIKLDLYSQKVNKLDIDANLKSLSIGKYNVDEEDLGLLFGYVCTILDLDWIRCNKEARIVTFDFAKIFEGNEILYNVLSKSKNIETSFNSNLIPSSGGYVSIEFVLG